MSRIRIQFFESEIIQKLNFETLQLGVTSLMEISVESKSLDECIFGEKEEILKILKPSDFARLSKMYNESAELKKIKSNIMMFVTSLDEFKKLIPSESASFAEMGKLFEKIDKENTRKRVEISEKIGILHTNILTIIPHCNCSLYEPGEIGVCLDDNGKLAFNCELCSQKYDELVSASVMAIVDLDSYHPGNNEIESECDRDIDDTKQKYVEKYRKYKQDILQYLKSKTGLDFEDVIGESFEWMI